MTLAILTVNGLLYSGIQKSTRHLRRSIVLLTSTALVAQPMLVSATFADDLPTGGQLVSGSVTIGASGSAMTVTQGSDKAIVNWNSFSLGQGNSVTFAQPNSSSVILNRVTGNATSMLAGSLTANGQVYLINPNGIAITPNGTIKVGGGFVASTLDMSNEDFLKGQYNFTGNGASAGVSNAGLITVGRGGYAALIGGTAKNDGLIAVPMGKVGLGSGERATLDLSGDGFLQVTLPTKDGAEGDGALIENSGEISAEGGTVVMKAATARNAARHAINLNGVVEASSVSGSDGAITLGGGEGGHVTVSGQLSTKSASGKGGKITVTGKSIALKGATVDASGARGGGTVKIGGDFQGKGTTQRADTTSVDASSVIRADATESGNGGSVVVWSDTLTSFAGLITALGAGTGTGGDAEVSGKALLDYAGFTNLSGPGGFGTLLLDPYNLTISSALDSNVSGGSPFTASGSGSVLNVTTLTGALGGANVTVTTGSIGSEAGNITVAAPISWTAGTTLTLAAAGSIIINKDISATGAGAGLVLTYGTGYALQNGARVSLPGAGSTLSIGGNAYTLIRNVNDLQAIGSTGWYALATDIDASATVSWNSGAGFAPIGSSTPFSGTFAGLGHNIDGLTINRPFTSMTGLFSEALNATLRDMTLSNVSVTGSTRAGALVGQADNSSLSNIHVTGSVNSYQEAGGIAGWISYSTLSNVSSSASVTVSANGAGGLVSYALYTATIIDSYATGAVTAASNAGGLVGQAFGGPLTLTNVYASGRVTGASGTGGLIGVDVDSMSPASFFLNNAYWDANSTGQIVAIGIAPSSTITGTAVDVSSAPRTQATYSGLDFTNTWVMIDGETRPMLRSEYSTVVATPAALQLMSQDLGASYKLGANIDLTSAFTADSNGYYGGLWGASGFVPIGSNSSGFTGSFDGQGHTITGLTISRASANYIGLFGNNSGGSIRDIGLIGVSIRGYSHVGGLVGSNDTGTISTAYTTGDVYGVYNAGGLIGNSYNSTISDAYSTAVVYGRNQGGGLIGLSDNSTISNSYATGAVSGVTAVGGLVGYSSQTAISNVFATGAVSGSSYYIGGLVGLNNNGTISEAYATGDVSGGGITVGGLVGLNSNGTISNTYAAGAVSGSATLGGLAGTNNNGGTVIDSFFDSQKSGLSMGVGLGDGSGVTGLTTAQISSLSTFTGAGWSIDDVGSTSSVWRIYDGYTMPLLRSFMSSLTVTGGSGSKTYDGSAASTSVGTLTYNPSGYTSSLVNGTALYTASGTNAGTYSGSNLTLSGLYSSQLGYDLTLNAGSMTITKAALTVTANNATKTYDGLGYAGGNGVSYGGFVNGESTSVLGGTLSYSGTSQGAVNAGTYSISASGLTSGNYAISYAAGTLTVNKAALTVTANNASKTYDGAAYSGGSGVSYSGFVGSDSASSLGGTLAYGGTSQGAVNAGAYAITASGLTSSNYTISYQPGTLTVATAALTVTANNATKTYDGLGYAGGNGVSYSGFVNGESTSVLGGTLTYSGTSQGAVNAGAYAITVSGLASGNYTISYQPGTLTVAQRSITVVANAQSMTYGDSAPTLTYTVGGDGFVNGDSLSGALSTAASSTAGVGSYAITQGTLSTSGNYAVTFTGNTITIGQRAITIAANAQNMTYGNGVPSLTYTVGGSGLANGDSLSGALSTTASSMADVGSYAITQGTLSASGNYAATFTGNTVTVGHRAITVTANAQSMVYGGTVPSLTYSVGGLGLVHGDSLSGALATTASSAADVGSYAITQGTLSASANYSLTFNAGTLTVSPVMAGERPPIPVFIPPLIQPQVVDYPEPDRRIANDRSIMTVQACSVAQVEQVHAASAVSCSGGQN